MRHNIGQNSNEIYIYISFVKKIQSGLILKLGPKDSAKFYIVKLCNILNINNPHPPPHPRNVYLLYRVNFAHSRRTSKPVLESPICFRVMVATWLLL